MELLFTWIPLPSKSAAPFHFPFFLNLSLILAAAQFAGILDRQPGMESWAPWGGNLKSLTWTTRISSSIGLLFFCPISVIFHISMDPFGVFRVSGQPLFMIFDSLILQADQQCFRLWLLQIVCELFS